MSWRIGLAAALVALACGASAHAQTPYLLKDVNPGSGSSSYPPGPAYQTFGGGVGDRVMFHQWFPQPVLWSTGGTEASTVAVAMPPGRLAGSLGSLGDRYLFSTSTGLWSSDGTEEGTEVIRDFVHPFGGRAVNEGIAVLGHQLSRTDGTREGTFPVRPPAGGAPDSTVLVDAHTMTAYRDGFAVRVIVGNVWLVGRGSERATRVHDQGCQVLGAEERLFLQCNDGLWVSDGTHGGTQHLPIPMTFGPGAGNGTDEGPKTVAQVEGRYYFRYSSGVFHFQLWTSDGTPAGTHPVTTTQPVDFDPDGLTASNGLLYFAATTPEAGRELWRTDGTEAGTFMVRDVAPGPASGIDASTYDPPIVAVPGGVVFAANDGIGGTELWRTDGTTAGTVALPQIAPGTASSSPWNFLLHRGRLYFVADDGVHGFEPWAMDLEPGVSVGDVTVTEGDAGITAASFRVRLEPAAATSVIVSFSTVAGSASAGSDFVPTSGTLTFAAGQTEAIVEVAVVGDESEESNEAFALQVVPGPGLAAIDARGAAVIVDDDVPSISAGSISHVEGNAGITFAAFPVTVTTRNGRPTSRAITVRPGVEYGTASAQDFPDFSFPGETATFPAGTASGTTLSVSIPVQGDTLDEPNETFTLVLDAGNDAHVPAEGTVIGTIIDDDGIAANPPVEIAHGSRIVADLAPPAGRTTDEDFYVFEQRLHASYEIVADAVSGDAAPLELDRVSPIGSVSQQATPVGTGGAVALRFLGTDTAGEHLRVRSTACGTACGADDVYRLRMYETTLASPRVNTVGTQQTVLLVQNTSDAPANASAAFWSAGGALASLHRFGVPAHGTAVLNVNGLVPQFSGSLTVAHNGPYGSLVGKVVSLDPATGFAFEAPLASKPK